ncbi:MAG: EscU/YscU/HrcU family type III secretion system export apparatus switch protein [Alphaproteobacteria bacterium]|nr:EscU/YscU/HrcU family type III secretion system export apparatus switch protein [Alphaproteobacteria bacterium]MBO4643656.1 EscU/YscU/HrcU family type III secretion system export apparatus switch protein [Alphaproteobacteria bacterium]
MTQNQSKRTAAVALNYDPQEGGIPTVAASGYGHLAEKILELAFAAGVKVRQDADLAEILAALDMDSEIPPEAFAAVAEILSYVYELNVSVEKGFALS